MLKPPSFDVLLSACRPAAFRRLCVETCVIGIPIFMDANQPPSGGCVLKHDRSLNVQARQIPAAFRRLCVETQDLLQNLSCLKPAAFRRLCVETLRRLELPSLQTQPPSGGCVLKRYEPVARFCHCPSRLQAAVC